MQPAARVSDLEDCPDGGQSPIITGAETVFIEGKPAARKGDGLDCGGGHTHIESGSQTALIEGSEAARIADTTCHHGKIVTGADTVFIGDGGSGRSTTLDKAYSEATPFVRG